MRQHRLYKAVWFWNEENNKLSFQSGIDREKSKQVGNQANLAKKETPQTTNAFYFIENINQTQQMMFRQKYQRDIKPHIPNVVTMQDIKDVVIFLSIGYIPTSFLELFCSNEINLLFRGVVVYIQLYLTIWEDLVYRSTSYGNQRLKHPISIERETLCKTHLSKLRSRIGQEYALIIAGEGNYKKYHHMNNTLNRSYTAQDMMLYNYFSKCITKVVWIALNRSNFKEIETEISRLFNFKDITEKNTRNLLQEKVELEADSNILQGNKSQYVSKWHKQSPVILDIFINRENPEFLLPQDIFGPRIERTSITGLEAAIKLPEELLTKFGVTVGILGQPRENFEPLLTVRQKQKTLEEEELEHLEATLAEQIKPKFKMYELLRELETTIDLENTDSTDESADNISKIDFYENSHIDDSKRSFKLFKQNRYMHLSF